MLNLSMHRVLFAVSCAVVIAFPFLYFGNYSGDSQLYLVYGENAADGSFFEFNLGEKSSGVTGTAWMLFIAVVFDLACNNIVPLVVKLATILFWFGSLFFIYQVAKMLLGSASWAWAATVVAGLIPGSVYNSTIGMETSLFCLVVWVWIYLAVKWHWFTGQTLNGGRSELILGVVMGLACWARPEGFVLAAIALSYRAVITSMLPSGVSTALRQSIVFLIPFLLVTGGLAAFNYFQSGHLLPTSGVARVLMSNLASNTVQLGPLILSPKFAIRLAAYFPLIVFWLTAVFLVFRGSYGSKELKAAAGFLVVLFISFFVLYSTFLSSTHLSRYIVFVMPSLVIVGSLAARWAWNAELFNGGRLFHYAPRITFVGLVLVLSGVFAYEANLRTTLDSDASLWRTMKAQEERKTFSDALFERVGQPSDLPISIALQEVQIRYWLDDRFVVNSLDGRTDPVLLDYALGDRIDHIGYLKAKNVAYLLETPRYNKDPELWSLLELNKLEDNDIAHHAGLTFTRLPVGPLDPAEDEKEGIESWAWFDGADGERMLYWFLETLSFADYPELDATIISVEPSQTN